MKKSSIMLRIILFAYLLLSSACGKIDSTTSSEEDTNNDTGINEDDANEDTDANIIEDTDADTNEDEETDIDETIIVVINEVAAKGVGNESDWIEFFNAGTTNVDISDWYFTDSSVDHVYFFNANTVLEPGDYLVLEKDETDSFTFGLGPEDAVNLYNEENEFVNSAQWNDGDAPEGATWGRIPNATGPFMTLYLPSRGEENNANEGIICGDGNVEDNEQCDDRNINSEDGCFNCLIEEGWFCEENPSICQMIVCGNGNIEGNETCDDNNVIAGDGCDDTCQLEYLVVINEIVSKGSDWIELYNAGFNDTNLSGWILSDSNPLEEFIFSEETILAVGEYLVLYRDEADSFIFGLGSDDTISLTNSTGEEIDFTAWTNEQSISGTSWGRIPNGLGDFKVLASPTPGEENADLGCGNGLIENEETCDDGNRFSDDGCSAACSTEEGWICLENEPCEEIIFGDIVLNEIASNLTDDLDWIELYNQSENEVNLEGWSLINSDSDQLFIFGAENIIPANGYLLFEKNESFNFDLNNSDSVLLYNFNGNFLVDATTWQETDMEENKSWGRLPNGIGNFLSLSIITPGAENQADSVCNNNLVEVGEACDGNDLLNNTCQSLDFQFGDLACLESCLDFDTSLCVEFTVLINEVVNNSSSGEDWFELYNTTNSDIDIANWYIEDDGDHRFTFAENTIISANSHITFERRAPNSFDFGIGGSDALLLFNANDQQIDLADWLADQVPEDTSFGRIPDGEGDFKMLYTPSRNAENIDNPSGSTCGDGITEGNEECDDGDLVGGDCAPNCAL